VRDPEEGVAPDGTIVTGAARDRVPATFEPVLAAAVEAVGSEVALYLYGSVATGQARVRASDVDLLSVGLAAPAATELGAALSDRFGGVCRAVEIGAAQPADFVGNGDERYGMRVFLRHYCVHLAGPAGPDLPAFPADARAARGFNGDIAVHARRWHHDLHAGAAVGVLARRVGRKGLLALASLVSVHDGTWTTDRAAAARRWSVVEPGMAEDLEALLRWSESTGMPDRTRLRDVLDGCVARIVEAVAAGVGLWPARAGRSSTGSS
jgi:hypothetical protein